MCFFNLGNTKGTNSSKIVCFDVCVCFMEICVRTDFVVFGEFVVWWLVYIINRGQLEVCFSPDVICCGWLGLKYQEPTYSLKPGVGQNGTLHNLSTTRNVAYFLLSQFLHYICKSSCVHMVYSLELFCVYICSCKFLCTYCNSEVFSLNLRLKSDTACCFSLSPSQSTSHMQYEILRDIMTQTTTW